jgi:hypothetical protein
LLAINRISSIKAAAEIQVFHSQQGMTLIEESYLKPLTKPNAEKEESLLLKLCAKFHCRSHRRNGKEELNLEFHSSLLCDIAPFDLAM